MFWLMGGGTAAAESSDPDDLIISMGDQRRLTRRLRAIIGAFLVIMLALTGFYVVARIEPFLISVSLTGTSAVFFALMLVMLRRDRPRLVGGMLVAYLYMATTAVALSFDGIYDTSLVVYFLLIAISGLLLGSRAALAASGFSALALALVYLLDLARGSIAPPSQPPFLKVVEMSALLLVMGLVLRLTIADLSAALARARRENEERRAAQAALARTRDELEERVASRTAELARANHDLNTLIQASRDGILFITPERRLSVVNERAIELLQLPGDVEHWRGRSTAELFKQLLMAMPDAVGDVRQQLARLHSVDDGVTYESEFQVGDRHVSWTIVPVARDAAAGELFVLHDVSAERDTEQMRRDLVHTMVHDLRNPLSSMLSILGLLQLLDQSQKESLSDRQRHYTGQLVASVEHMRRLVNNILDVSRLESGQMPLHRVALPVDELVAATVRAQHSLASAKQLSLQTSVNPALPAIMADRSMIERVLQNLLDNAIKYTPQGGRVLVSAQPADSLEHTHAVRLTVQDTGPGIPPDVQPKLFQKFAAGNHQGAGSGLGLAFCRLTVEAHGGQLWLDESQEAGASFVFTVPAAVNGSGPVTTAPQNPLETPPIL